MPLPFRNLHYLYYSESLDAHYPGIRCRVKWFHLLVQSTPFRVGALLGVSRIREAV